MNRVICFLCIFSIAFATVGWAGESVAEVRPNIVLLLADDLGYGDLACFGSPAVKTPHLDRLANEGMRCTRFYAASAVCSPTRASVLTGRYPLRFNITRHFNDRNAWLPKSATTVAELLNDAGYNTAHVGKWHLGGLHVDEQGKRLVNQPGPRQHGFDVFQSQIEQQPLRGRMGRERGKWKLLALDGKPVELFDIEAEPNEQQNVIAGHRDLVASLASDLEQWLNAPRTTR